MLLLEAGGADGADEIKIPAAFPNLFRTRYDWYFTTVEQKHVLGRRIYWPRGKVLGGSSSINAMIYIRGNRLDFDTWRDEYGCTGWGYDDLLPYFRRAEDNARGASAYHGTGGPLRSPTCATCTGSARRSSRRPWRRHQANDDFNGPSRTASGCYQVTQRDGRRWSAANAYLQPALGRPNLTSSPMRWSRG